MVVLTEGPRPTAAILSEAARSRSRENGKVGENQTVLVNGLVALVNLPASVGVTQTYSGTGNGVLTIASPGVATKARDGKYTVTCFEAATNAGKFNVEDPSGRNIGVATVGVAFNKDVKFTIADGSTDFAVGDAFVLEVQVELEDEAYVPHNPSATDGSEVAYGYSPYAVVTGSGETKQIAVLVRECELNGHVINWASGITSTQKADAIQALAKNQIIVRN
jgi:hypothetical protein